MLGQMVNITACPRCHGSGQIVETPCLHCRGEGRLERKKTLRVTIPAGIDEGHQIRLSGEGEAGPRGGTPGSLYVVTHVDEHPVLKRDGTELYLELTLSVTQAALGTEVPIPTPDGEELLDVKPGTQPGTEIRRRGKGVPHLRRPGSAATSTCSSTSRSRPDSRPRARALRGAAAEAGELDPQGAAARPGWCGTHLGAHPEARADASVRSATASRTRSADHNPAATTARRPPAPGSSSACRRTSRRSRP